MGLTNKLQFILAPEPPIPTRREHYNYNWNLVDEKLGGILDGTIKASEATHAVNADNADKVDGFDASAFALANHTHDSNGILNGAITKSKLAISVRRRMLAYGFILGG